LIDRSIASYRKTKGVFHTEGYNFTGESWSEPGGKRRLFLTGMMNNAPNTRLLVLDGAGKGWRSDDGFTYELDSNYIARIENSAYADKVCGLTTLLKDKGYTLTLLGETQVKGAAALGVKVQKEGKQDVSLYFDKTTFLLVKAANNVKAINSDNYELQEVYYSNYQVLDPAGADERLVRAAKVPVDGPALLTFLRRRVPGEAVAMEIRTLILELGHKVFAVRQRATAALIERGAQAAPLLRQALSNPDREVSRRAEQCLEKIDQGPEPALAAAVVRLVALRRPADSAEALMAYLPWAADEAVAREVQAALHAVAVRDGKQDPYLVKALKDADPQRRAAAAAALGQDGGAYEKKGWRRVVLPPLRLAMTTALYRDGRHFMDLHTVEVHYYNRLDDSLFTRP
jgi:hypothetical protein